MYTCPCCGYKVFEKSGNWEICPICFWEDDGVQSADPWYGGGANIPCLADAQKNYEKFGAMEERFQGHVRRPTDRDEKDPEWRLVNESDRALVPTSRDMGEIGQKIVPDAYWKRNA